MRSLFRSDRRMTIDYRTSYRLSAGLRDICALVIDMDGVLWQGNTPMPGLLEFFTLLRSRPIHFRLATNNPSRTPEQYVAKLAGMGVAVLPEEILTSAIVTAQYLATVAPGAPVYVIGQDGLRQALADHGLHLCDGDKAEFVVVGLDQQLTYAKLAEATLLIRAGARFIGCNPDATLPSERGQLPGNGATLAYLQASTGVAPLIIGKPQRAIFDVALAAMNADAPHTATLGDRIETDILGGKNAGLHSILVLSGVTSPALLAASPVQPDWVFDDIRELTVAWSVLPG
jgi:4-nitrophenyl phosphatase